VNARPPAERDFDDVLALLQAADIALLGESDWVGMRVFWEAVVYEKVLRG
jgi:hypothetical protein